MTMFPAYLSVEHVGWVLIHSLWQFAVIALVVRLCERAFTGRNGASGRYYVGVCGLAAITLAPVVTWALLPTTPPMEAPESVGGRTESPRTTSAAQPLALPNADIAAEPVTQISADYSLANACSAGAATLILWSRPLLPALVTSWLVGMAIGSLRPAVGWCTLRRLCTVGVSAVEQSVTETANKIAMRLSMSPTVLVLNSTLAKTPMVVGFVRPALLLPVGLVSQLPLVELEAILAHELAHIRRHDFLVNLWQLSLETVFFYHPAIWNLSQGLRVERENCCDDLAVSVIGDPVSYGRALLHIEELRGSEPLLALGANGGSLKARIQRLFLQPAQSPAAAGVVVGVFIPGFALFLAIAALAWGALNASDDKQTVSDWKKQLADPKQDFRDIAAANLRKSFVAPSRSPWDAKVARLKSGMTRDEVLEALELKNREPSGTLPNDVARDYRLDDVWVARLWQTRHITPTQITRVEVIESLQRHWVDPPANFSGRWTTYYVNGHKSHEISYRNGKYDGEHISFHSNGKPNVIQHYSADFGAHGTDTGYYPSGKTSYRGRYFRGERIGTWTHYDEDGQVRAQEELPIPSAATHDADGPAPSAKPAAARSLNIVIAQHVILWDGRIRTWDEVQTELREIRKVQGKPIHPHFYFTNGAHAAGHWDKYKAKAFEIYKELFEPAGISLGSISPRAGPRYDVVRTAEDLVPDPRSLRTGIVVENGKPKAGVLVVLVPEEGQMPVVLKSDLTLRDPLDEVWTVTGTDGRFTLPVQPAHAVDKLTEPPVYSLAAISPSSYRLVKVPAEGKEALIALEPLSRIELTPVEDKPQRIDLSFHGGLPEASPGYTIYETELLDKSVTISLPPGKVTVMRAFKHRDGGSRSYPAKTLHATSGDRNQIKLPNVTAGEAEQAWIQESIKPKP